MTVPENATGYRDALGKAIRASERRNSLAESLHMAETTEAEAHANVHGFVQHMTPRPTVTVDVDGQAWLFAPQQTDRPPYTFQRVDADLGPAAAPETTP